MGNITFIKYKNEKPLTATRVAMISDEERTTAHYDKLLAVNLDPAIIEALLDWKVKPITSSIIYNDKSKTLIVARSYRVAR